MALALHTTTFDVLRSSSSGDDYWDGVTETPVAYAVKGHLDLPSGLGKDLAGAQEEVEFPFQANPADITHNDVLLDNSTGLRWHVEWVEKRVGLGLDHLVGRVSKVTGGA